MKILFILFRHRLPAQYTTKTKEREVATTPRDKRIVVDDTSTTAAAIESSNDIDIKADENKQQNADTNEVFYFLLLLILTFKI